MSATRIGTLLAAMSGLAALDVVGALCAKEYAERHRPMALILGLASFVVLFGVYVAALRYAELSIVTMGWIVILQVALLAIDRGAYGLQLQPRQWVAVAATIALQCYLIVSTSPAGPVDEATAATVSTPSSSQLDRGQR